MLVLVVLVPMMVPALLLLARLTAIPYGSAPQAIGVCTIPKECLMQAIAESCKLLVQGAGAGAGDGD